MVTNENMKSLKVSDLTLEQLVSVLASKEDFHEMKKDMQELKDENKLLSDNVKVLNKRCDDLERQMESMYLFKNNSNLIVKISKSTGETDAKQRVASTCAELAEQPNVIQGSSIVEVKSFSRGKRIFKAYLGDANIARKILHNTSRLQGSDISITKDLPKQMREQQSKLLMVRRFLMTKSTAKPKVRDNILIDGYLKFSWSAADGLKVISGESLDVALGKYNQSLESLNEFLSSKYKQGNASNQGDNSGGEL